MRVMFYIQHGPDIDDVEVIMAEMPCRICVKDHIDFKIFGHDDYEKMKRKGREFGNVDAVGFSIDEYGICQHAELLW